MSHINEEEWTLYVNNGLSDHIREEYENHLYDCDHCLQLYLKALANHENQLPVIENEEAFTEKIMTKVRKKQPKPVPYYKKAAFHYIVAAAATIFLTLTGVFQSISSFVDTVQNPVVMQKKEPSFTEGMMNRTFAWVDSIEEKNKEEQKE